MDTQKKNSLCGLSQRHVAQIIRRKMLQKTKPSGKAYRRIKFGKKDLVNE
jgi:hypothetical protein